MRKTPQRALIINITGSGRLASSRVAALERYQSRGQARFEEAYTRPTEVDALITDPTKAEKLLGRKAQALPDELARITNQSEINSHRTAITGSRHHWIFELLRKGKQAVQP